MELATDAAGKLALMAVRKIAQRGEWWQVTYWGAVYFNRYTSEGNYARLGQVSIDTRNLIAQWVFRVHGFLRRKMFELGDPQLVEQISELIAQGRDDWFTERIIDMTWGKRARRKHPVIEYISFEQCS